MQKFITAIVTMTVAASTLLGQAPADPVQAPVQVKRNPPPASQKKSANPVPLPQNYDFGLQLQALQDVDTLSPAINSVPPLGDTAGNPPKDYKPRTDVPLNPTALEAVRVSETWRGEQNTPAAGSDGRVLYAFGAGLPVVGMRPLARVHRRPASRGKDHR